MQISMPFSIKLRIFDTVSLFDLDARDKEKARLDAGKGQRREPLTASDGCLLF